MVGRSFPSRLSPGVGTDERPILPHCCATYLLEGISFFQTPTGRQHHICQVTRNECRIHGGCDGRTFSLFSRRLKKSFLCRQCFSFVLFASLSLLPFWFGSITVLSVCARLVRCSLFLCTDVSCLCLLAACCHFWRCCPPARSLFLLCTFVVARSVRAPAARGIYLSWAQQFLWASSEGPLSPLLRIGLALTP